MRKTFCDRHPDIECTSRIGRLHFYIIHQTNKGEIVSEDEYRPRELCGSCIDELLATFLAGTAPLPTPESLPEIRDIEAHDIREMNAVRVHDG